ncbi:hypothetical protein [Marinobacter sp.]|uniref:hypothetical protein n=1 Tax=Marinobacter sp. TaxID=50741 RepID=UPI003850734A
MNYLKFMPWLAAAAITLGSPSVSSEVIFEEDFDNQPDFTSTMHTTTQSQYKDAHVLPDNWDALHQGTQWSPEKGYPDNHASLEILGSNSDKARGGAGKSMVNWRESYSMGWKNWASDSQLLKLLPQQYDQLYVEFWIAFSSNWYGRQNASGFSSKLFRVGSWTGQGDVFNGAGGELGPIFLWDYKRDNYGIRNVTAYRGNPEEGNYFMNKSAPEFPRFVSKNFGSHTLGEGMDDTDPLVLDQIMGGYLKDISSSVVIGHDQLFGAGQHWTKMGFYVKLNSAPNMADGQLMIFVNGQRVLSLEAIPWIKGTEETKMRGWNYFAIGGNDYLQPYPNEQRFEDWYAIDDVVVRNDIPSHLLSPSPSKEAPSPPTEISVD